MSISTSEEYSLTQTKLVHVREMLTRIERQSGESAASKAASLRSLRAYANQLIEELRRYEAATGQEPKTPLVQVAS